MSNTRLIFYGTDSKQESQLQLFCNTKKEIFIQIETDGFVPQYICLDRETAIKLSKTLKAEISKIRWEVDNV